MVEGSGHGCGMGRGNAGEDGERRGWEKIAKLGRDGRTCTAAGLDLRMLIDEGGDVVDVVVDDDVDILLGRVLSHLSEGEFLGHGGQKVKLCGRGPRCDGGKRVWC